MTIADDIKADLPNIPNEVVETWLVPLALTDGYGWPPNFSAGPWRYVLLSKSLDYWKKTTWKSETIPLQLENFEPLGQYGIQGVIAANVSNAKNEFSDIVGAKQRFNRICKYVLKHGTLPVAPVVKSENDLLKMIDGNHRVAALTFIRWMAARHGEKTIFHDKGRVPPEPEHMTWIITPPAEGKYEPDATSAFLARLFPDDGAED